MRAKRRFKDGEEPRYRSVVENCRNRDGRVVQRQVLYLGEINDSQRAARWRSIEGLQGDCGPAPMALFPMIAKRRNRTARRYGSTSRTSACTGDGSGVGAGWR